MNTRANLWAVGLLSATLILSSAYAVMRWHDAQQAATQTAEREALLTAVSDEVSASMSADLRLRASLLAADSALTAYIADAIAVGATPGVPIDRASISDLLGERRTQLELDWVGVIDVSGRWIAGTRPWPGVSNQLEKLPLYQQAVTGQAMSVGLLTAGEHLQLAAIEPMVRAGVTEGYLLVAQPLDTRYIERLTRLLALQYALLRSEPQPRLAAISADLDPARALAAAQGTQEWALQRPIFGADSGVSLLALAPPPAQRSAADLAVLTFAALCCGVLLAALALFDLRVRAPAAQACALLERAAAGDFHLRAPSWQRGMRGRYARAFDSLMARLTARASVDP